MPTQQPPTRDAQRSAEPTRSAPGDDRSRARLRWRCRRGMLENDLILTRFLDARGERIDENDVAALDRLLDLADNDLWDLLSGRAEPEDASKWAANFTGELRQEAIDAVMQNWMHSDPQSSAQWLAALPDDAVKQSAMLTYIINSSSQYPGLAATFVAALTDEQRRATAINDIASSWLRTDPKAATAWLKKTALPPDQIQRLLDGVPK